MPYLTKINENPQKALRFYDGLHRISRSDEHNGALEGLRIAEADLISRLKRANELEVSKLQGVLLFLEELFQAVEQSGQTAEKYYRQLRQGEGK